MIGGLGLGFFECVVVKVGIHYPISKVQTGIMGTRTVGVILLIMDRV